MEIIKTISLDFGRRTLPPRVYAKQKDHLSRKIRIKPLDNGQIMSIGVGVTARVGMTKPDKNQIYDDVEIENGEVVITLTQQMLAAAGVAEIDVTLYKDDKFLSSQVFELSIERAATDDNAVESSSEYTSFRNALNEITEANERADEALGVANNAYTRAQEAQAVADAAIVNVQAIPSMQTTIANQGTSITALQSKDTSHDIAIAAAQQAIQQNQNTIANMGDGRVTVDGGYGNISALPKTAAIAAMNAILYGMLATNLVTNGDYSNGTTGWSAGSSTNTIVNGNLVNTASGAVSYGQVVQNYAFINGNTYYIKAKLQLAEAANSISLQTVKDGSNHTFVTKSSPTSGIHILSGMFTASVSTLFRINHIYGTSENAVGKTMTVFGGKDGVIIVDLTATGETTLTLAQLDAKYATYFNGTQSTKITCIEATGKNLFDGKFKANTVIAVAAGTEGDFVTTANARTTNPIRCNAGETYVVNGGNRNVWRFENISGVKIPFVSNNAASVVAPANAYYMYVYYSNDGTHTNVQIEKGSTATTYEPYRLTEQYIEPYNLYRTPNNAACKIDTQANVYVPNVKRHVLTADDITNLLTTRINHDVVQTKSPLLADMILNNASKTHFIVGNYPSVSTNMYIDSASYTGYVYFGGTNQLNICVPKGFYASLTAAKTALAGTVIYYQMLAAAVEQNTVKGIVSGNLLSRPNGTIQFCNKHSFISLVTNGVLPTRTWYADIGSVERLEKFNTNDNTWTPLDVSLAVISADKRYATLPAQYNGSLIRCKYSYTYNGVNGRKDINYLNAPNLVLGADGKYYRIGYAVDAAGAISLTKTEVA